MNRTKKVALEATVTVKLDEPSYYRAGRAGSLKDWMHRLKVWFAYRHYRELLKRYLSLDGQVQAIAEIGCGPGYCLSLLEQWFPRCEIIGFDYDIRLLEDARQRTTRAHLMQGNAEALPFDTGQFDALVTLHLVEHLYHPERFIIEAKRVLKPGGILLLATPNPAGIGARIMKSRWNGWRPDHVSVYAPMEWIRLAEQQDFTLVEMGSTMLSGIPIFQRFPLSIVNYIPLVLFGMLPWKYGEAFVAVFKV